MMILAKVDRAKCTEPFECHKCVEACPRSVLSLVPTVPALRGKEIDRKDYTIIGRHMADCSTCMDCVRLCPEGALAINVS